MRMRMRMGHMHGIFSPVGVAGALLVPEALLPFETPALVERAGRVGLPPATVPLPAAFPALLPSALASLPSALASALPATLVSALPSGSSLGGAAISYTTSFAVTSANLSPPSFERVIHPFGRPNDASTGATGARSVPGTVSRGVSSMYIVMPLGISPSLSELVALVARTTTILLRTARCIVCCTGFEEAFLGAIEAAAALRQRQLCDTCALLIRRTAGRAEPLCCGTFDAQLDPILGQFHPRDHLLAHLGPYITCSFITAEVSLLTS